MQGFYSMKIPVEYVCQSVPSLWISMDICNLGVVLPGYSKNKLSV
jgi:hypothetical protein